MENTIPDLIPYRKGDKWGFCNSDKEIVIDCIYDYALTFEGILAGVNLNGKWGFIDIYGKQLLPFVYDKVGPYNNYNAYKSFFRDGMAAVQKSNFWWGFIDNTGKEVIPCKYHGVKEFSDGLVLVNESFGWSNFINKRGDYILKHEFLCHFFDIQNFSEGLAVVSYAEKHGKSSDYTSYDCYINKNGEVIKEAKGIWHSFEKAHKFSEGLGAVLSSYNHKYGYINKFGKLEINFNYDDANDFSEDLASVKVNSKWGFIDKYGKLIIPIVYDGVSLFSEGFAAVIINGKWGFIDNCGKLIIPCIYDDIWKLKFSDGLAKIKINGKWGFIDTDGKTVAPFIYDYCHNIEGGFNNGLAKVIIKGKSGYIDRKGTQFWED